MINKPEAVERVVYTLPERKNPELHIFCEDTAKPWVEVGKVLNDLGIGRDKIEKTVYQYFLDEKKGQVILCKITFKQGTSGTKTGNRRTFKT